MENKIIRYSKEIVLYFQNISDEGSPTDHKTKKWYVTAWKYKEAHVVYGYLL